MVQILGSSALVLHSSSALPNYMPEQVDNPRSRGADLDSSAVVLHSSSALPNYMPEQVDNPWSRGADIRFFSCSSSQ